MCGIAGILAPMYIGQEEGNAVRRMCDMMLHRGPDDSGLLVDGPMALGHRRLSIIDLRPEAAQPMTNEDGTVALIINGEIYNFREIRSELKAAGHIFRSRSDSEVVIHLYEEKGLSFLDNLRGMFALALWDSHLQQLILARDRFGKKPLFYHVGRHGLVFASELQAMARSKVIPREPDLEAIDTYLALQYVPSPFTIYKGVRKLPPGHQLVCKPGEVGKPQPYFKLRFDRHDPRPMSEISKELRERIKEAVRIRLVADVPIGAFLSGGIDSSLVVAIMAQELSQPVKTFSIGFPNEDQSELAWAREVAERYKTDHHEMVIEPHMISMVLPDMVRHYGEPYGDTSALPTWYLSRLTRQTVTVALSGDGGDEAFAGYNHYGALHITNMLQNLSQPILRLLQVLLSLIPMNRLQPVRDYVWGLTQSEVFRYLKLTAHFPGDARLSIYSPDLKHRFENDQVAERLQKILDTSTASDAIGRFLDLDTCTYLPDDILVKVDIASMAHSLEVRCPLLDQDLMSFVASIPTNLKLSRFSSKIVLRSAMADMVPQGILNRRKQGFDIPVDRWVREDLEPMARDLLLDRTSSQRGLFDPPSIAGLLERHNSGESRGKQIWTLIMLEQWFRTFIDRSPE